jgi:enoyl-[acyl-carrier protein] reductase II
LARRLEKQGVDALIAEGKEGGGHIGELTTVVLVPQVADAVQIPVIAAGGISDGRGLVAALALGAQGVQVGTRFVCAEECTVHMNYKKVILKAKDRDTMVTGRSTGHPVRVIRNKLAREYDKMEKKGASLEELEAFGAGKLALAVQQGDVVGGSVMAGQSAGMVHKIEKAADIIKDIMQGAEKVFQEDKD